MANLAAANMMHRKTRTAVSVLAVAMEVAMVMLMVGLANGTLDDIAQRLQNVGADVLFQAPDASMILGASSAVMPVKFVDVMLRVPGVTKVAPVLNWHVSDIKGEARAVNLWAVDYPSFASIGGGLDVVEGTRQPFGTPNELVMDTVLASAAQIKAGDRLHMLNRDFTVSAICRAGAGGRLYASLKDIQEAIGTPDKASFFLVKGQRAEDADKLVLALQDRFKGYKITAMAQVSKVMQDNAVGLQEFKQALTAMAVVISFMVVLLAMYTTIIERTREIGILRAIGATQAKVVQLVIMESFLICVAGVLVGIVVAVAGRYWLPYRFPTISIELSREWTLIAASLGLVGGLLGSVYPALRAARMDPVQALNFE